MFCSIELFKQYGFKNVTMDDVARRAGISKKTLYAYFDNKHALVLATITWYKDELRQEIDRIQESAPNAIESFLAIKDKLYEVYKEVNPLAIFELQRFYQDGYQQFRCNMEKDVESLRENLLRGQEEGLYREDIDVEVLARYHIESSMMLMMPNDFQIDRHNFLHINHQIVEHFLYGVMTPKGEKIYRKYSEDK